ncbi:MAG: hypothetical protein QM754_08035 [Tepidisphaeraceae bacterium]
MSKYEHDPPRRRTGIVRESESFLRRQTMMTLLGMALVLFAVYRLTLIKKDAP